MCIQLADELQLKGEMMKLKKGDKYHCFWCLLYRRFLMYEEEKIFSNF